VRAATGDIAWQVPLGITAELPEGRQRTGRPNVGGPIATAGGLVLIGASDDRYFRAFDAATGEELWAAELPHSAHSVPATYLGDDGKQYVAIVAAGSGRPSGTEPAIAGVLMVYSLP
jgi:quinoprotein glucose dehydrogenase